MKIYRCKECGCIMCTKKPLNKCVKCEGKLVDFDNEFSLYEEEKTNEENDTI